MMQRVLFVLLVAVATAYTPPSVSGVPKRGNLRKAVALKGRTTIGNLGDTTPSHIVPKRGNLRKAVAVKDRTTIGNLVDTMPSVYVVPQRGNLRKAVSPALKDITTVGNLVVPNLGIGTIAWTANDDEGRLRIDTIAQRARESGLDFFDTAERYGASAVSMIPSALAGVGVPLDKTYLGGDCESNLAHWGAGAKVATKFTPTPWRRSVQDVIDAAKQSAERLGVDSIGLYQIHFPDVIQPFARLGAQDQKDEVYWDGLIECYKRGLVKNVGVSNYGPSLLRRAHAHLARHNVPLASNQIAYNLLTRRQGSDATVLAGKELGVKTLAYYPLAMGLLTGKLHPERFRGKGDPRSRDLLRYLEGGQGGTAGLVPAGGVQPLVLALERVASARGKTAAQVALNWIICKGAIPIPGASCVEQITENVGALGWRLSPSDISILEEAADTLPFDFNGCGFQTTDSKFVGYGFEKWRLD